jgi:hypothetical protein
VEVSDLVRMIAGFCSEHGLEYFVTGSVAGSVWGMYRTTHDVDVVVVLPRWRVRDLRRAFPESEFYLSEEAAADAIARCGQFNIIHQFTGLKIDVIIPEESAFTESRLARARPTEVAPGITAMLASPEDVILNKLIFYRSGHSPKHLSDIANILKVRGEMVDRKYIEQWAAKLGVVDEWTAVREPFLFGP